MEIIIFVSLSSFIFSMICFYLFNRQNKIVQNLKVGDKISIDGSNGEITSKLENGNFVVKIEVSGMRISKRD